MASPADIHREMADAWNRRDFEAFRALLHDDYTYVGPDGSKLPGGAAAALEMIQSYALAFTNAHMEVTRVYVQGNTAIAETVFRGTHTGELMGIAPTGWRIEVPICNIAEVRDGKVYREREYFDMMHLMTQLGVVSASVGAPAA